MCSRILLDYKRMVFSVDELNIYNTVLCYMSRSEAFLVMDFHYIYLIRIAITPSGIIEISALRSFVLSFMEHFSTSSHYYNNAYNAFMFRARYRGESELIMKALMSVKIQKIFSLLVHLN